MDEQETAAVGERGEQSPRAKATGLEVAMTIAMASIVIVSGFGLAAAIAYGAASGGWTGDALAEAVAQAAFCAACGIFFGVLMLRQDLR